MRMIQRSVRVLLAILPALAPPGTEAATLIFNDGGVHTINGPSDPVVVSNGTTLNILDGAAIMGASFTFTPAVSIKKNPPPLAVRLLQALPFPASS